MSIWCEYLGCKCEKSCANVKYSMLKPPLLGVYRWFRLWKGNLVLKLNSPVRLCSITDEAHFRPGICVYSCPCWNYDYRDVAIRQHSCTFLFRQNVYVNLCDDSILYIIYLIIYPFL